MTVMTELAAVYLLIVLCIGLATLVLDFQIERLKRRRKEQEPYCWRKGASGDE